LNLWQSFLKVFQAADGEDLVILACIVFGWSTRVTDGQTDRIAMAKTRYSSIAAVEHKKGRKGKGRKGTKSHASVIFHLFVRKPLQTDFHQILHIMRYARRNHLCKFWCGKN